MPDPDTNEVTPEEIEETEVVGHNVDDDEELPACIVYLPD
jgi:hypothetical protein